jgi:nicotinate phosphoribosyltransferase
VWGVGTKLATAYDQPALGGIYKLAALKKGDAWDSKIKLSEQTVKVTTPGALQVRRFFHDGEAIADMIHDIHAPMPREPEIVDPFDFSRRKRIAGQTRHEDLLIPIFRGGRCVYEIPALEQVRRRTGEQLAQFHAGIKRFVNPHEYPVGLERGLHEHKTRLILKARGVEGGSET